MSTRTVVFSDAKMIELLNKNFVCVWKNIRPTEEFGDDAKSAGDPARAEGAGDQNICAHFATADGKILHAAQSLLTSEHFTREMEFALKIAEAAAKEDAATELPKLYADRAAGITQESRRGLAELLLKRNLLELKAHPLPSLKDLWESKIDRAGLLGTVDRAKK